MEPVHRAELLRELVRSSMVVGLFSFNRLKVQRRRRRGCFFLVSVHVPFPHDG